MTAAPFAFAAAAAFARGVSSATLLTVVDNPVDKEETLVDVDVESAERLEFVEPKPVESELPTEDNELTLLVAVLRPVESELATVDNEVTRLLIVLKPVDKEVMPLVAVLKPVEVEVERLLTPVE